MTEVNETPIATEPELTDEQKAKTARRVEQTKAFLETQGFVVRLASEVPERTVKAKATKEDVRSWLDSLKGESGLERKGVAEILGVTVSLLSSVSSGTRDFWTEDRFLKAQIAVDAELATRAEAKAEAEKTVEVTAEVTETEEVTVAA